MNTIRRYSMFIGGDWVDADERFEIRSPATEGLVASVAKGGREPVGVCAAIVPWNFPLLPGLRAGPGHTFS